MQNPKLVRLCMKKGVVMQNYLIIIGIVAFVLIVVLPKVIDIFSSMASSKKDDKEKMTCLSCGKTLKGKPAKCPFCGEKLRWKNL